MKAETVYIKAEQSTQVVNKKIFVQDVAKVYCLDNSVKKDIDNEVLYTVKGDRDEKRIFSVMKLVEIIEKIHPGITVVNMGEKDFVVEYKCPHKESGILAGCKTIVAALLLFVGGMFTMMTFNTDVSVGDVFNHMYEMVTGQTKSGGSILEIAYSIGIPIGILLFYNHFTMEKIHDDPTPVQIEMRKYEEEMNKAIIQNASRENKEIGG